VNPVMAVASGRGRHGKRLVQQVEHGQSPGSVAARIRPARRLSRGHEVICAGRPGEDLETPPTACGRVLNFTY
jgi:hypothetical protein